MITARLVVVGDEILNGRVQDANSVYLAQRLTDLGVTICEISAVGDRRDAIRQSLREGLDDYDIVIATGGLGPTPDDMTKAVAARLFSRSLLLDEAIVERIERHFTGLGQRMPAVSTNQALVPQGAIVLENPVGLAPGLVLVRERKSLILLPGIPIELQKIFETGVVPFIEANYYLAPPLTALVRTTGIAESAIVELISPFLRRRRAVTVAYLPSSCGVDIRLTTEKDRKTLNSCQAEIAARLNAHVYSLTNARIEEAVGGLLRERRATLSTAESCTGGLIAGLLTDVPGSSDYYLGGAVAYGNETKKLLLGVSDGLLKRHGAVSAECAAAMATGARTRFASDYAVAATGIAGPGGGTADKPVGLVFMAVAGPKRTDAGEYRFAGVRRMIRERAAIAGLDLLRLALLKK